MAASCPHAEFRPVQPIRPEKTGNTFTRLGVWYLYPTDCGTCNIVREMITNRSQERGHAGKGCWVVNMPHYWKMKAEERDVIIHSWEGREDSRRRQRRDGETGRTDGRAVDN